MRSPSHPRRVLTALAGALLIGGAALYLRWWDRYVEDGLARWAVGEVARRTDSAYRLILGDLEFHPLQGSLAFDSAVLITDTLKSLGRAAPLPAVRARASGCVLSGVNAWRLFRRSSFDAREMGCESVIAGIVLVARSELATVDAPDTVGIHKPVEPLPRPLGLSRFRIGTISFPALSFVMTRPGRDGNAEVVLEHARLNAETLDFDPTAPPGTPRALSATKVQLTATGLVVRPDTLSEMSIGRLQAGITDSTLRLDSASLGPSISDDEWVKGQDDRHDRIRFSLDSLQARGVRYRTLLWSGDIVMRALEVRGAKLDVLTDKRLPVRRRPKHRSPQEVTREMDHAFQVDTAIVEQSEIVYRERKPDRPRAGRVSFDSVSARIVNLHLPSSGPPMEIEARCRLMNRGVLEVKASVPLSAPDFSFTITAQLGPMPATALNQFLAEAETIKFGDGQVERIDVELRASKGVAVARATPRYRKLSIDVVGKGGGVLGSVKRAVVEFAANAFKVRSDNPEREGKRPQSSRATRRYNPEHSWIQFIWFGTRDALKEVILK